MYRMLNNYEKFLWSLGRQEPFLVQWTLMLAGRFPKAVVGEALSLVQKQHPLLNSTITSIPTLQYTPIKEPIRLTFHRRQDDASWEKYALKAVNKSLPLSEQETFLTVDCVEGGG